MTYNYRSKITPTWCPGCNNFIIYAALQQAFAAKNLPPHKIVVVYDIGCSGNMADFLKTYGVHSLHGRAIPVAIGIKKANPSLTVVVIAGDGGTYGEGLNHLVSAARLNIDIKVFVANNYLYSLTTGQASPTTPKNSKTKSTPEGVPYLPLDPVNLLKSIDPETFAQSVDARQVHQVNQLLTDAISYSGFALVDIKTICIPFGKQLP